MRRALALPVSAAVVGALLAIGVSALDRSFDDRHERIHVVRGLDQAELANVDIDLSEVESQIAEAMERVERIELETEIRVERDVLREVREQLRSELGSAVEAEELTAAQREKIQEAMEQLAEQLPMMMGLPEIVDDLSKEDGSAHKKDSGSS